MPKGSPEPSEDAALPAEETKPVNYKKITLIVLAAIVCGLGVGVAGALALREFSAPQPATVETAAAPAAPAPAPVPAVKVLEPAAPAPASAAPAEGATPATVGEPSTALAASIGVAPIPVLTGAEIKERYNITRFVDGETNQLCYLAEPRSPGLTGSLDCEPRPAGVSGKRGE